ncbi:YchJ family metal-binding protein [Streptomyces sp. MST-110588]|uniref:YchJ family protein n=1 Tax=Streptomyces sp. MST-110588 TaxID=2833628 RepID=UPI001F5E1E43|nr:YchJ family metal-binding protein [Streptomyces sp. MST-110588]
MSKNHARRRTAITSTSPCPCGLGRPYGECCGSFHRGRASAPTAERLMRSRYSAFAVGDVAYLLRTWHPSTRPAALDLEPEQHWTRLEILGSTGGSAFHNEGTVAFRAHFVLGGYEDSQYENSRFVRDGGQWVYLDALPDTGPTSGG